MHHHEWTTAVGYWAHFCCSISVRWVWVFALPHTGTREDTTPFKACSWDLSPLLDRITVNACLYIISLYTFLSRYNGHKLQWDWSSNKQTGDLGMLIFVFSHHNAQQHIVDPQSELKAVSPVSMGESSSLGPWHFPWQSKSCLRKPGDLPYCSPIHPSGPNPFISISKTRKKTSSFLDVNILPASFLPLTWPLQGLRASLFTMSKTEMSWGIYTDRPQLPFPHMRRPSNAELQPSLLPWKPSLPTRTSSLGSYQGQEYLWVGCNCLAALDYLGNMATQQQHCSKHVCPWCALGSTCPPGSTEDSFNKVLKWDLLVLSEVSACPQTPPHSHKVWQQMQMYSTSMLCHEPLQKWES